MLNIEKNFSHFSEYCGFRENGERGIDPKQEGENDVLNSTGGAKPLSNSLLYEFAEDSSGIVWSSGSVGCWFEIDPLVGSNDGIEKNLTLFFNDDLPNGGVLQFLMIAGHGVDNILDIWKRNRKYGGEVIDNITHYREYFIQNCANDFSNYQDGRLARNYRSFVCFAIADEGKDSVEELLLFQKKLANKLKAENLNPRKCISKDLIEIGRDILQMSYDKSKATKYNPLNNLSDQIIEPFVSNKVQATQIDHVNTELVSKVFAPLEIPECFSLSEMIKLLGDEYRTIPARFIISYSLANNLGAKGASNIKTQGARSIHAAGKEYTQTDILAQEEAQEWMRALATHKKGEIFLEESMLVMITAPKDNIDISEEVLKSLYNSHDWKLAICEKVQRLTSLAILPMMPFCYWDSLKFFKISKVALSGEVVAKLPLQGEWKGVPVSGALLIGRRGQLFNFNPFYRIGGGGNYNVAMMAPPGSGKSFLLQEIAQSMVAADVSVFVMDIGGSYKNLCQAMEGEMVRFNRSSSISLNPFASLSNSGAVYYKASELLKYGKSLSEIIQITGLSEEKIKALQVGNSGAGIDAKAESGIEIIEIKSSTGSRSHFVTKDSIIYAKSMVAAMCGVCGDGRGEALIERAIIEGIEKEGNQLDITKLSDVLDNLKDKRGNAIEGSSALADHLYPYTEEGIHGRFFAAGEEASFKKSLTVFELEELVNDQPLLAVVLQVVLMQITMQFLCGDRSKRFMLIVDEAWMILDYAASFLERFARTVRKYGGSLVVCTQDLTSFSNENGDRNAQAAVLECSTWKLILQQKAEGIESFGKSPAYQKYLGLIKSIRKCSSNKFSEVLINTDGATVVGRFAADPYSTAMFSTEDKDYEFLLQQERLGVKKHDAILKLSKKYGKLPDLKPRKGKGAK